MQAGCIREGFVRARFRRGALPLLGEVSSVCRAHTSEPQPIGLGSGYANGDSRATAVVGRHLRYSGVFAQRPKSLVRQDKGIIA